MPPAAAKRLAINSSSPTPRILRGKRIVRVAQQMLAVRRAMPAGRGALKMRVVTMRK